MNRKPLTTAEIASVPGLCPALCALSFFRRRHAKHYRGKRRIECRNLNEQAANKRLVRDFIRQARAAGFRGSIRAAIAKLTHP